MHTVLLLGLVFLGVVQGSEWKTSGGYHCTEKCKVGKRREIEEVFWCPVVDGSNKENKPVVPSRPNSQNPQIGITDEDKIKWDYCTPALVAAVGNHNKIEKVTLPALVDRTKRQIGNFNPGNTVIVASSLPGVDCVGSCRNESGQYKCEVPGDEAGNNPNEFFCSPKSALERKQLTSKNKLWCIGPCLSNTESGYYECNTLFGPEKCSPSADRSSKSDTCFSPCKIHEEHYQCHTDDKMTKLDDCGLWNSPKSGMKALEYTVENKVCASSCDKLDGSLMCSYVEWEWKEDEKISELRLKTGSCDPNSKISSPWKIYGIILGCAFLALMGIGIVAALVAKKKYSPAPTGDV